MKKTNAIFSVIVLTILFAYSASGLGAVPKLQKYVNDNAGILDSSCIAELNSIAGQIEKNTTAEIAILTMKDIGGQDPFSYSLEVARQNGIGKADKNNGLLIFVTMQEKKWQIQTGYGLEGTLPDALLSQIAEQNLVPYLHSGDYCTGFKNTINAIKNVLMGGNETTSTPQSGDIFSQYWIYLIFFPVFFIIGLLMQSPIGHEDSYSISDSDGGYEVRHRERCPRCGGIMRRDREERGYIIYKCKKCGAIKRRRATKNDKGKLIPLIIAGGSSGDSGDSDSGSSGGGFSGGSFGGGGCGGSF